jgi:hypothetical protein
MNKSKILTFALAVLVFLALGPLPEQSRSVNAKGNLSFPAAEHTTSAMPIKRTRPEQVLRVDGRRD